MGHPLRWRLLRELSRSDRRVGELCELVGRPRSLVSYHPGRLRAERLVSMRRSSADRRDAYYRVDLVRCGELLAATGEALHPALRVGAVSPRPTDRPARRRRARVLFLCTGNSARSQMAEALVERLSSGAVEAFSAGSHPKPLNPAAVRVMRGRGIELAGRRSKHLSEFTGQRFDAVISLCDRVRKVCPEFPGYQKLVHWSIAAPAGETANGAAPDGAFQRTASELALRIVFLLELIGPRTSTRKGI